MYGKIKVLACDAQKDFLIRFEALLNKILSEMNVEFHLISFTDSEKALIYIKEYIDIDIVFMDVLAGKENGYEIAKCIRTILPKSKIIFLSTTAAYALKGYSIKATSYLIKPIKQAELLIVLKDIVLELQYSNENYIVEKNDDGIHKLFLNEIIFIETYNRNTLIHTTSGNIISYKSMKEHESRLNNNFVRCHSSYIVNMIFIKDYQGYEVFLLSNEIIWVSKNRRKEFLHRLMRFYGKLLN